MQVCTTWQKSFAVAGLVVCCGTLGLSCAVYEARGFCAGGKFLRYDVEYYDNFIGAKSANRSALGACCACGGGSGTPLTIAPFCEKVGTYVVKRSCMSHNSTPSTVLIPLATSSFSSASCSHHRMAFATDAISLAIHNAQGLTWSHGSVELTSQPPHLKRSSTKASLRVAILLQRSGISFLQRALLFCQCKT